MVFLGSSDPVVYGGLQNTFNIYNLELGVFFTYSLGGKIYNISEFKLGTGVTSSNKYSYMVDGAWHAERNPGGNLPSAKATESYASSRFVHDSSFLRLKTLSISYRFDLKKHVKWLSLWGGVMTSTAKGKKVKAACIDGGIRDTHQILEADFPVFYEYRISNGSLGRCLITHYQIPIKIGGVTIKPGDVILGDIDGVLVVPRDIAYDVLIRAEEIKENEKKIFSWVHEGQTIQEIADKGGYF
jgi:hypothetical protein